MLTMEMVGCCEDESEGGGRYHLVPPVAGLGDCSGRGGDDGCKISNYFSRGNAVVKQPRDCAFGGGVQAGEEIEANPPKSPFAKGDFNGQGLGRNG
jgi:hypothetical protein